MDRQKLYRIGLTALAAAVGVWLFAAFLLPLTLPFWLAFALAAATEKPAAYLQNKMHLSGALAGILCTAVFYLLVAGLFYLLIFFSSRELFRLAGGLPDLLAQLSGPLGFLEEKLTALAAKLPDGLGPALGERISELFASGAGLLEQAPGRLLEFAGKVARAIPELLLFTVTTVVASFMASAQTPRLKAWLKRTLPPKTRRRVASVWRQGKRTVGAWCKAQGEMMLVTFAIVTAGLLLSGNAYPLVLGAAVAATDALPLLGSGTILLPWALISFLRGQTGKGLWLLGIYAAAALTRSALEPRLVGRHIGVNPLVTLAAFYIGYRLAGFYGVFLFPIAAAAIWRSAAFSRERQ